MKIRKILNAGFYNEFTPGQMALVKGRLIVVFVASLLAHMHVVGFGGLEEARFAPLVYLIWLSVAAGAGAIASIILMRDWLGGSGMAGFARALVALMGMTIMTFGVASALVLPLYGRLLGPLLIHVTTVNLPIMLAIWFSAVWTAHLMHRRRVDELSSIYKVALPEDRPLRQFSVLSRLSLPATLAHQRARWTNS